MSRHERPLVRIAALDAAGALFAGRAAAASEAVESAKANCLVGEQLDGYLGVVDPGRTSEAVKREVADINLQRKAAYARLAAANGVTVETTAAIAAEKLIERAPSGHCVQAMDGGWVRQP